MAYEDVSYSVIISFKSTIISVLPFKTEQNCYAFLICVTVVFYGRPKWTKRAFSNINNDLSISINDLLILISHLLIFRNTH